MIEGKYDKTSHLMIYSVNNANAGKYVCVATNLAGLVRINVTLDVETLSPVASGLDTAQITGLGVALLILLTIIVALLLLAVLRRRASKDKDQEKVSVSNFILNLNIWFQFDFNHSQTRKNLK